MYNRTTLRFKVGQHSVLVDSDDEIKVSTFRLRAEKNKGKIYCYAYKLFTKENKYTFRDFLHNQLIEVPPGMKVVHDNGDTMDNRKCNLKLVRKTDEE